MHVQNRTKNVRFRTLHVSFFLLSLPQRQSVFKQWKRKEDY